MEKLQFEIEDAVNNERDLEINFAYNFSTLRVIQLALKYNLIEEFKQFVDRHKNLFKNYKNYRMIHPKYRKLYPIAFKDQSWDKFREAIINEKGDELYKLEKEIVDYIANRLIPNKCMQELEYFISIGKVLIDTDIQVQALKSLDDDIIKLCKGDFSYAMNIIVENDDPNIFKLFKKGYYPDVFIIGNLFGEHPLRKYVKDYSIIDALPKDRPLDDLKCKIATDYPELVSEIIERYGKRFKRNDPSEWNLYRAKTPKVLNAACNSLELQTKNLFINKFLINGMIIQVQKI